MDTPATLFQLNVNLSAVLRQYRASEHTTTGKTPYELISLAPIPVMFPSLQLPAPKAQSGEDQRYGSHKVRNIGVGDIVLLYDTQTRTSSKGTVKYIQSRNSYIVKIGDKERHASGDHITVIERADQVRDDRPPTTYENINSDNFDTTSSVDGEEYFSCEELSDNVSVYSSEDDLQLWSVSTHTVEHDD